MLAKMRKVLALKCREATELISRSRDTGLQRHERIGLRMHLLVCYMCRRFARQIEWLSGVSRHIPEHLDQSGEQLPNLSDEARDRLIRMIETESAKKQSTHNSE